MNLKERLKNPYFIIGLVGVIFTSAGIDFEMMTNWDIFFDNIFAIFKNPFLLASVIGAVIGVFVNPTTKGFTDKEVTNDK